MAMIFCRGCGKEIHESATVCPQCGAPQAKLSANVIVNDGGGFFSLGLQPLTRYTDFNGRARRKEYWYFAVMYYAVIFMIGFVGGILGDSASQLIGGISILFALGMAIPSLAVGVRRMHDTNRRGWWLLLPIVNLVFLCIEGQQGSNRFGDDPKAI